MNGRSRSGRRFPGRPVSVMVGMLALALTLTPQAFALPLASGRPAAVVQPAAAAVAAQATTTALTVTPALRRYGAVSRAAAVVRVNNHAPTGVVEFAMDGAVFMRVRLPGRGQVSASVPITASVGRRHITARYLPDAGGRFLPSRGFKAIDVVKANAFWVVTVVGAPPVFWGSAAVNVSVHGPTRVPGTVSLMRAGRVLARAAILVNGSAAFRLRVNWPAGVSEFVVSYGGSGNYAAARTPFPVTTLKAGTTVTMAVPSSFGYGVGATATVSVSGAGAPVQGSVVLSVDGRAVRIGQLSGGRTSIGVPAQPGGRHTVTATYTGDTNHSSSSRSTTVTAASASPGQCPAAASACIDLTHSVSWLQSGGKITYGPVPISSGRPGYRTSAGTFHVYWRDINHHSSQFNNAPMPYSQFFDGGIAFHEGDPGVQSHGCIHLSSAAAVYWWNHLSLGDEVFVFGYAPY